MKKIALLALSFAAIATFSGCSDDNGNNNSNGNPSGYDIDITTKALGLTKATSCDDYRRHVLDNIAYAVADEIFGGYYYGIKEDGGVVPDAPDASINDGGAAEYTTTNVQEAGVDELDTVKNDGNYMYSIREGEIHIAKIWPVTEMKEVATIPSVELKSGDAYDSWFDPAGIFLTDDKKLIDVSRHYTWSYKDGDWFGHYSGLISIRIFDVSAPESPKLLKAHQIEGEFVDARLIDNRLHLISSAAPQYNWYDIYKLAEEDIPGVPKLKDPRDAEDFDYDKWSDEDWEQWYQDSEAWYDQYDEHMKEYLPVIRAWVEKRYPNLDSLVWPNYYDGTKARPAVACSDLYIPSMASNNDGFLIISEFSGSNYENYKATAIADDGWTVYASKKNLYISSTSSDWWWSCGEEECKSYTHIHHFNLGDNAGSVKYINSAEIDGHASDSFYYSEYKDHLRVFSSLTNWGNSAKGQKISVLDINTPSVMKETGSFEGFGKDETIHSARMIGDRGYVVTFRNTDPLFVFDLSDPANPKQTGELKVNGYSSYIHPVGEHHLLTIGEDGDDDGDLNGMKLDLYDVSDPTNPVRKFTTKINESKYEDDGQTFSGTDGWSEALNNHHAFQYHEASGLLAIPVNIYSWKSSYTSYEWDYHEFSGMFVYRVTPNSDFEFLGGVNHGDLVPDGNSTWWTTVERSRFYFKNAGVYDKDAYIYTTSYLGLKASNANKPDETFGIIKFTD